MKSKDRGLFKPMRKLMNNKAFNMVELLMAVAFSLILLTGVYGFYTAASQVYSSGISAQVLQNAAGILLSQIIEGQTESNVVYRLSTAETYTIADGTTGANTSNLYKCGGAAQITPCNTGNPSSEIYFCQDNPANYVPSTNCNYNDTTARWYYLNFNGSAVIYHHPTTNGGTVEQTIYTAPKGSTINLRFSPAQEPNPIPPPATVTIPNVIEIDVDLTGNVAAGVTNKKVATSGDVSTFVLLRNHP